jgi:hypothetical protein
MGLKRSIVPRISLAGGITGFCTGMSMIWWTGAVDYKLIVGGKPYFSPMFAFPVSPMSSRFSSPRSRPSAACSSSTACRCTTTRC